MKRISLWTLLVATLFLSISCQTSIPTHERIVANTHVFDVNRLSDELVKQLTKKQINLIGEHHFLIESNKLYIDLIPQLHANGVRIIAVEGALPLTVALDYYVRGEIPTLPGERFIDSFDLFEIVEPLKDFNERLRSSGQADEMMRLVAFDIDPFPGNSYTSMFFTMKRLGLNPDFSDYIPRNQKLLDDGVSPGLSGQLNEDFVWYLKQEIANREEIKRLGPGPINYLDIEEFRENAITDNVEYFVKQLGGDDKLFIITGRSHIRKADALENEYGIKKPLATRLIERGYDINAAAQLYYRYPLPNDKNQLIDHTLIITTPEGDLSELLRTEFKRQPIWIALDEIEPDNYEFTVTSDFKEETITGNLMEMYDTLIIFPTGTWDRKRGR